VAGNLTRDEARERADLLRVESYQVDLDLTSSTETFRSVTTVTFDCTRPGGDTFIELVAPAVTQITLNGRDVAVSAFAGDRIALTGLAARNELRVTADCAYSRTGEGLHRFADPADGGVYMYSDLETTDAHRIFACFDQPDLKATFEFTVTAAEGWQVISNMAADRPEPAGPGKARWHFRPTPVMSTYITAIAAGPYHAVTTRWPPTSTRMRSSRSPGRASISTSRRSASGTRSASTTSCSCPSTSLARWRMPAA
jgi:aminopeptidase N